MGEYWGFDPAEEATNGLELLVSSLTAELTECRWDTRHEHRRALLSRWERRGLPHVNILWGLDEEELQEALVAAVEAADAMDAACVSLFRQRLSAERLRRAVAKRLKP